MLSNRILAASLIAASLAMPLAMTVTPTMAGAKTEKVLKTATTISNTAKKAIAVAKVVAPKSKVVKLLDANIKIYSNVGCQLGKLVYGSGC